MVNVKRLLAVASLVVSSTAMADTPRLLRNGRPACGNTPSKKAARVAEPVKHQKLEQSERPEIVVDLSGLPDRAQPQPKVAAREFAARERRPEARRPR